MWKTESGERTLVGSERKLFTKAVVLLVAWLDESQQTGTDLVTGADIFDSLPHEQKLAMLDHVTTALLHHDVPAPKLTAVREATVGAVFEYLVDLVELEIADDVIELRPMILAAAVECGLDD